MIVTNERVMRPRAKPELLLEWVLFASRWILAPLYLSMVSMLAAIFVVFLRQLLSELPHLWTMESEQVEWVGGAALTHHSGPILLFRGGSFGVGWLGKRESVRAEWRRAVRDFDQGL
jgi:hypothetical protein